LQTDIVSKGTLRLFLYRDANFIPLQKVRMPSGGSRKLLFLFVGTLDESVRVWAWGWDWVDFNIGTLSIKI